MCAVATYPYDKAALNSKKNAVHVQAMCIVNTTLGGFIVRFYVPFEPCLETLIKYWEGLCMAAGA